MSRFRVYSDNAKFDLTANKEKFVPYDDYEYNKLTVSYDEENGVYHFSLSNPSVSVLRAFDNGKLWIGVSMADITSHGYDHRCKVPRKTMNDNRPYNITKNKKRAYWKRKTYSNTIIENLNEFTFNINKIRKPYGLKRQKEWVQLRIEEYGWPASVLKDKVELKYKFILVGPQGRVLKSYSDVYTIEIE